MTDISICGTTVRKHDPDRFLLSMFAPPEKREALWALYAFNYEIARTRDVVTEPQLGLIRLQWWRDSLAEIYEGKALTPHPVLDPLAEAIRMHDLPHDLFETLLKARELDLRNHPPATMEELVSYADMTSTPLLQLSLKTYGEGSGGNDVKNIATAYALTGILRSVAFYQASGRALLSPDTATAEVVTTALTLLKENKNSVKYMKLHAKLAEMYLKQIKVANYDLFSPRLQIPPFLRELRLLWQTNFI